MTTIDRYVMSAILKGFATVLLVLVALFSVVALVGELDELGKGSYRLVDALQFVLLTIPSRAVSLAAVSGLLGGIFGLGALAASREILAMRTVGQSVARFAGAALTAGVPLVILLGVALEWVAPSFTRVATERRGQAISDAPSLLTERGFWVRDGDRLVRLGDVIGERLLARVEVFDLSPEGDLLAVVRAERAEVRPGGTWLLMNVDYDPVPGGGERRRLAELPWQSSLGPAELGLILREPEALALSDLRRQIQSRKGRGHDHERYEYVLWRKLLLPFETVTMILLSLPFVLGSFGGLGLRLGIGMIIGVVAYLLSEVSGHVGLISGLPPALAAIAPVALEALAAVSLLRRAG